MQLSRLVSQLSRRRCAICPVRVSWLHCIVAIKVIWLVLLNERRLFKGKTLEAAGRHNLQQKRTSGMRESFCHQVQILPKRACVSAVCRQ